MNWSKFLTYGDSPQNAFEIMSAQIFERYIRRTYSANLIKFRVINGAGGDGGLEAYGELDSTDILAVQAKWFRDTIAETQIAQIRKSVTTALALRPQIKEYFICIPRDVASLKFGRGKAGGDKKPIKKSEEKKIDDLTDELRQLYPQLQIMWWFEKDIELQLLQDGNEGIQKYWFDRELISSALLRKKFTLDKAGWLHERYVPELHGQGLIFGEYEELCVTNTYRKKLSDELKYRLAKVKQCVTWIDKFSEIETTTPTIREALAPVRDTLTVFVKVFEGCLFAIETANHIYTPPIVAEIDLMPIMHELDRITPDNLQKNTLPKLLASLRAVIDGDYLQETLEFFRHALKHAVRLVLGDAGTGKTHGLANCVEAHLNDDSPAMIIRAKGAGAKNWTDLLSGALEITGWQKEELLSALEASAIRVDVLESKSLPPGEDGTREQTKVVICIDGIDEDTGNFEDWYARIREAVELTKDYPRIRFMFSARRYFFDTAQLPGQKNFKTTFIPHEGDVRVMDVAPKYFSKEHYNIQLLSYSRIRGINSLLALRLFCDEYRNRTLTDTDQIITATRELINLKINRINKEFVERMGNRIGATRKPIHDALNAVADYFRLNTEVEHDYLVSIIAPLTPYLQVPDIDTLIDYLAQNGFLTHIERPTGKGILKSVTNIYTITYQSLIEHIISENIYLQIVSGTLTEIPQFIHDTRSATIHTPFESNTPDPNERITQNIVNNLLAETGKLIGIDNFLNEGFEPDEILKMQLTAIRNMHPDIARRFIPFVEEQMHAGYLRFSYVIEFLILPSSFDPESTFGAEYLHNWLLPMSVFERDKIWSGFDRYELGKLSSDEKFRYQHEAYSLIFSGGPLNGASALSEWNHHNDRPLVYAWGLSTIDQQLRHELRVALTDWAIKRPSEFYLLLEKVFHCNDPQIHEDLASIALGVASRVKEQSHLGTLAKWGIDNIFTRLDTYRNIIVRQGFRAIVERAFQVGAISAEIADQSRPKPMSTVSLLPLQTNLQMGHRGECYPIVHDLAWYVINKSFDKFLALPGGNGNGRTIDNDCPEAKALLDRYRQRYKNPRLFAYHWALSAAIAYIRGLGFTRQQGNGSTQATHGGKSEIFTYEEKYTWLAVHHIQGYLSDYVPAKQFNESRKFIKDYSQLTDIPNPAESLQVGESQYENPTRNDWIIKEYLSNEMNTDAELKTSIENWVNQEPDFDPDKWLNFDSKDFDSESHDDKKWTAIFNHTGLHDSQKYVYARIDAKACLVKKEDLKVLKDVITSDPDSLYFITSLDRFHSSPQTDTYSNPTDITWMSWIGEDESTERFFDPESDGEKYLSPALTQIIQTTVGGERYWNLPSKTVRALIDCYDFENSQLKDSDGVVRSFIHKVKADAYDDIQEIVTIDNDSLERIRSSGYELVWFFEHFKEKNPLNKSIESIDHLQKVRKYFVWMGENGQINIHKFWNEWASNVRDKDSDGDRGLINPFSTSTPDV